MYIYMINNVYWDDQWCILIWSIMYIDMINDVYWYSRKSVVYFCPILMKLEFSRHVLEKYTNTKFDENPSTRKTEG